MQEPRRYEEEPVREFVSSLSDQEYADAMRSFIVVCTDIVAINRTNRTFYLAKRVVQSGKGVWRFGGRQRAGETMRGSCIRLMKRETGLSLDEARFAHVMTTEDLFSFRKQEPSDAGQHGLIHIFAVELSPEELTTAHASMNPAEYDPAFGIEEFDRERIAHECAFPQMLDLYDAIFP